ncbi:DUF1501 domain-containing protein [bacterium]|nr:DUF1501 domain-containing protein [bacterium]
MLLPSRRDLLRVGSLGLMGVALPRLLDAQSTPAATPDGIIPSADACVVIFLNGGPSHLDMWDVKPDAPDGIRGEFQPIATSIPGYPMSEHLPRLAQQVHRSTVVRSMHHGVNNAHAAAVYAAMTGHDRGEIGGGARPSDYPTPGSVVSMIRPPERNAVSHVVLPYITKEGAAGPPQPGFFAGFVGGTHDPLFVLNDPNSPGFSVPELTLQTGISAERLSVRRALFHDLDQRVQTQFRAKAMSGLQGRAIDLLTSEAAQRAFRISDEPDSVRDSYGRNIYGQSTLLARRLIEAGTRLVTLSWAPDANATWDTHGSNFKSLKERLLPQLDAACSSLITDLADRGMLDRTVIAIMGDFGRTPKINGNNAGRDHWNYCYSLMLAGGGFAQGQIYGASDSTGAFPAISPLIPGDIISTIYRCLGIRHDRLIHDQIDRPHRLVPSGDVVPSLLG